MRLTVLRAALAALASTLALAGCGLGAGEELGGGAELRVTRDFGSELLAEAEREQVRESDTAMRLLQSELEVETAYGGGFVESIDGLESEFGSGEETDWFYFVNGIEASVGAASFGLSPGDVVHWDYRDWGATMRVPAIVGAFPEPFLHGYRGERIPTRVECEDDSAPACEAVKDRLADAGVTATGAPLGAAAADGVLRVVVGTWPAVRQVRTLQFLERGPASSGVFARPAEDGAELALLDERGREVRTLADGWGLVAASRTGEDQPVWAVTGADEPGVEAAVEAFDGETLADAFAVAVEAEEALRLPLAEEGG